jgi:hypothetical protein
VFGTILTLTRLALAATPALQTAESVRVSVQAQPRFESVHCRALEGSTLELRARLVDDVGTPIGGAAIEIAPSGLPARASVTVCGGEHTPRARRARVGSDTDANGELCLRVSGAGAEAALLLRFPGDSLHLPAQATVPLQPAPAEFHLAFEAPSLELDLDRPKQRLTLQVSGDDTSREPLPTVNVELEEGGRRRPLAAREWLRSGSALSFSLSSEALGAPGPARLLAQAPGSEEHAAAVAEAVALRTATVRLSVQTPAIAPDSVELNVSAQSSAGAPPSGWVDASLAGQALGSSPLERGSARFRVNLPSPPPLLLSLRYHSDDPWWQSGDALELQIDAATTGEPARWPWLVLLAPIGYVCLRALERPASRKTRRPPRVPSLPARSTAAAAPPAPIAGWSGSVRDAHDGHPIGGARVEALLPSLLEGRRGLHTATDAEGHFALPSLPEPIPEGARLQISSPLHAELERPLPPQGRVDVVLISRRRALLARLVRWARAAGGAWQPSGEPTPGEVANVALRRGEHATARWAENVEAAAFDGSLVDREREAALHALEPPWQRSEQRADAHDED